MLTGPHWWPCVLGLIFMTAALVSILVFLAYAWKNREDLSQRILNVLFTKLAISNLISAILLGLEMVWRQYGMNLSVSLKVFVQIRTFFSFGIIIIFLELSVCSLLRLYSSQLYMWVSLHIPHTAYTIIQTFMIVIIQYLCIFNADIGEAQDVTELVQMMNAEVRPVAAPMIVVLLILHIIVIIRSRKINVKK